MEPDVTPAAKPRRRHRFLKWLAILFLLIFVPPFVWFMIQFSKYYGEIKGGHGQSLSDRRLVSSISSVVANTNVTKADLQKLTPAGLAPELGARKAKVTIVEFVDYQCPYCQQSAIPIRNVMSAMGDRVHLYVRDFPIPELHPDARQSAMAANCVLAQGQEQYWRFYDEVFADQAHQSPDDLRAKAATAGADVKEYDSCVTKNTFASKIDEDYRIGVRAGVQGTPTFFVNGARFEGAVDEKKLTYVLNALLEQLPK